MKNQKFRVWSEETKTMSTPGKYKGDVFMRQNGELVICIDTGEWEEGMDVSFMKDPLKLIPMMWIGLKDKNGTCVFDGDILEDEDGLVVECAWKERYAGFYFYGVDNYVYEFESIETLKVIGNVYENKNLLKKQCA